MTAQLLYHVQNFEAITLFGLGLKQKEIYIKWERLILFKVG